MAADPAGLPQVVHVTAYILVDADGFRLGTDIPLQRSQIDGDYAWRSVIALNADGSSAYLKLTIAGTTATLRVYRNGAAVRSATATVDPTIVNWDRLYLDFTEGS